MKSLLFTIALLILAISATAQAPEKVSYQAVIRDASNGLVKNQTVSVRLSILKNSETGTAVYAETHSATTNANGLLSLKLGNGLTIIGSFSGIDWSDGPYFILTETDPTGGTAYSISGSSQLLSVPYALHAVTADSIAGGISFTETDPFYNASVASGITSADTANWNNQIIDTQLDSTGVAALGFVAGPHTVDTDDQTVSLSGTNLTIEDGNTIDLSSIDTDTQLDSAGVAALGFVAGVVDTDDQTLSLSGTSLSIADGNTVDLIGLQDGIGTDDQTISFSGTSLSIEDGNSVDLSALDTDTQLDSAGVAALGFVAGAHTIDTDTQLDSTGVAALGYVAGAHTIDTQIDSTGIAGLGFVAGALTTEVDGSITNEIQDLQLVGNNLTITNNGTATTIDLSPYLDNTDTQLDSAGVAALGFVAGAHTIDTDTQLDSTGVAALGYVAGAHTIDTQIDSTGIAGLGFVAGALTTEVDGSITNEIQDLQLVGNNLTITNNGTATTIDLSPYLDNTDTQLDSAGVAALGFVAGAHTVNTDNQTLALSGTSLSIADGNSVDLSALQDGMGTDDQTISLSGTSLSIEDGNSIDLSSIDTDTQLSEAQVDAFVSDNGYLTSETDGSTTNEIQDLSLSGNNLTITNNGSATTIDLSGYLDNTDTQLTEAQVDAFVSDNGYLTSETDGSTTNEIQDLSLSGNNLTITNNGSATTIDLSGYLDNTDTQLTEAQVDAFVSDNGYLTSETDGSTTNEIQDLSLSGNNLTITNNGSATTIDLSGYLDNTDTQIDSAGIAALGFVAGPHSTALQYKGTARAKNQGSSNPNVNNEIPNGSMTKIRWLSVSENYGNSIGGTNNTEITIPAGVNWIRMTTVITYDQNLTTAESKSQFIVFKDGSPFTLSNSGYMGYQYFNSFYSFNYTTQLIPVTPGEVFDIRLFQNSGASLYLSWGSISSAVSFEFYSN